MINPTELKGLVSGVFDRAAATYEQTGVEFFGPIGRELAAVAEPRAGERVLDVGCGRGASLFPAAEAVGPTGSSIGVDLAPAMVEAVNEQARSAGWRMSPRRSATPRRRTSRGGPSTRSSPGWCCSSCPTWPARRSVTSRCCGPADGWC